MPYQDKVGDVVKLTMAVWYDTEQIQEVGIHWSVMTAGSSDSRSDICTLADTMITAHICPFLPTTAKYLGSKVDIRYPYPHYQPIVSKVDVAGSGTAACLPGQVRICTNFSTELAGRMYRGRWFGFTPTLTQNGADNHPTQPLVDKWNLIAGTFLAGVNAKGSFWLPVIYHYRKPPLVQVPPDKITDYDTPKLWATQRRGGDRGQKNVPVWE
jgi:hypothetical protein